MAIIWFTFGLQAHKFYSFLPLSCRGLDSYILELVVWMRYDLFILSVQVSSWCHYHLTLNIQTHDVYFYILMIYMCHFVICEGDGCVLSNLLLVSEQLFEMCWCLGWVVVEHFCLYPLIFGLNKLLKNRLFWLCKRMTTWLKKIKKNK